MLSKQEMESAWKDKVQDIEIHCQRLCNDLTDKYHHARGRLRVQEEQSTLALNTAIDAAEAVLRDLVEKTKDLRDHDGSADQATSQLRPLPLQSVDNTHHRIDCAPVMTFDVNVSNSPVIGFLPMPSLPPGPPPLLVPLGPPPPPVPDPPPPPHPASEAAASRGAGSQVRNYSPSDRQMLMATVDVSHRACQEELRNPSYEPQHRHLCISSLREGFVRLEDCTVCTEMRARSSSPGRRDPAAEAANQAALARLRAAKLTLAMLEGQEALRR